MKPSPPHTESAHGPLKVPLKGPEMLGFSHNGEIVRGVRASLGCSLVDKLYLPGIDFPTLKCMCSLVRHSPGLTDSSDHRQHWFVKVSPLKGPLTT